MQSIQTPFFTLTGKEGLSTSKVPTGTEPGEIMLAHRHTPGGSQARARKKAGGEPVYGIEQAAHAMAEKVLQEGGFIP